MATTIDTSIINVAVAGVSLSRLESDVVFYLK